MILEKNYLNKTYICDPTLPQTLLDSYNMNIYQYMHKRTNHIYDFKDRLEDSSTTTTL